MDTSMTDETKEMTLKEYIDQYNGHNRFTRLISIIENSGANQGNKNEKNVTDAIVLGYELAAKGNVLGMFKRVQQAAANHFKNKQLPANLSGASKLNEGEL